MLIDTSYFTKAPRHIANSTLGTVPDPAALEVCLAIEQYIAEYQEEYLRRMLGGTLGNKVNAYLVCLDEDADEEGGPRHVAQLDELCDSLRDTFADYVFFHILRDDTQATMTGLVRLKCANEYVSPISRQVDVWNRMVDRHRLLSGLSPDGEMLTKINRFNL